MITVALGLAFLGDSGCCPGDSWCGRALHGQQSIQLLFLFIHGGARLHLLGGILALGYLMMRTTRQAQHSRSAKLRRAAQLNAATIYWHFMDGLWGFALFFAFVLLEVALAGKLFARDSSPSGEAGVRD